MKIAIINDTHFGVRNDLQAMFLHQDKFNKKFFQELKKRKIKTIIHIGDLWDRRKYISFVTLNKTREIFLDPLKQFVEDGGTVHMIPGNHDIRYRNTLSVNSLSETLGGYPFNIHLKPTEINIGGKEILLVPWICDENEKECLDAIKNTKALVCLGHFHINGIEMHRGRLSDSGLDRNIFSRFDFVGSGHFHHRSVYGNVHYLGAPYQFTWADYNDPRGFTIFDLEKMKPEFLDNPFDIFKVFHYNDEANGQGIQETIDTSNFSEYANCYVRINIQKRINMYLFDQLLMKIQKAGPIRISIMDEHSTEASDIEIDIENEILDTRTILERYVESILSEDEWVKTGKPTMSILSELYNEAVALETIE